MDSVEALGILFEAVFISDVYGIPLVISQLDMLKAHDMVPAHQMIAAYCRRRHHLPSVLALSKLQTSTNIQMVIPGYAQSQWVPKRVGYIQGDPEASKSFDDYCDMISMGCWTNGAHWVGDLLFLKSIRQFPIYLLIDT